MSVIVFDYDANWKSTWHVPSGTSPEQVMHLEKFIYPWRRKQVMEMLARALDEDVEQ